MKIWNKPTEQTMRILRAKIEKYKVGGSYYLQCTPVEILLLVKYFRVQPHHGDIGYYEGMVKKGQAYQTSFYFSCSKKTSKAIGINW